ncbi:hypothetical protein LINGRAHAP2_LOCUS4774 [Linum grandiflorum]
MVLSNGSFKLSEVYTTIEKLCIVEKTKRSHPIAHRIPIIGRPLEPLMHLNLRLTIKIMKCCPIICDFLQKPFLYLFL